MDDAPDFVGILRQIDAFLGLDADDRPTRTRARILRAATDLFVAYGYRKTSVDDVASAAGVAKGTIYLSYRSKAELLVHAIALQKRQYLADLAPAFDPEKPPADRLREMIRLGILMSRTAPLIQRATSGDHDLEQILREVDAGTITSINEMQIAWVTELIDAATGGTRSRAFVQQRAEMLIDLVFAVVNGGRVIRDGLSLEGYASELADVIVHGLLAPPG